MKKFFLTNGLRTIRTIAFSLALLGMLGGHWALLQSFAWGKMLQTYTQQSGLEKAVKKTFSGKAPCPLCRKIAQGRTKEAKKGTPKELAKKKEGYCFLQYCFSIPWNVITAIIPLENSGKMDQRKEAPPKPYP